MHEELESRSGFDIATPLQGVRLLARGLRLRCPHCGGGPVLKSWFKLRVRCGSCGLRLERGEHDYFAGSLLLNYCLSGVLFLVVLAIVIISSWPEVPWDALQYGAPLGIIATPFVLFPFTKLLWLAADIIMRPVTPEELEWHRSESRVWSTDDQRVPMEV